MAAVSVLYFGAELFLGELPGFLTDWALFVAAVVLGVLVCVCVAWSGALSRAATVYWRIVACGLSVIALSMVLRGIGAAAGVPLETAAQVVHGLGAAVMLAGTVSLPIARRNRAARLALALDMATLMAAAAVFFWHLAVFQKLSANGVTTGSVVTAAGMMAGGLVAIFLMAEVVLTGSEALSRGAVQMMFLATGLGTLGSAVGAALVDHPELNSFQLNAPPATLATAISARRHLADTLAASGRPPRARRRYSVLPYFAVAAVDAPDHRLDPGLT